MTEEIFPPFSARNRGAHAQIDDDCPETARIGIFHLLRDLIDRKFVESWRVIAVELERIGRVRAYQNSEPEEILLSISWEKVFDFCERLHTVLAKEVLQYNPDTQNYECITPRTEVQEYITNELRRLFLEENLAFDFSNGSVRRRGRRHTADRVARAELVLGDPRLSAALDHFNKALRYFRNVSQPDPQNVVKEAVCAVEATARVVFPSGGQTLGDVVKSVTGNETGQLPKSIAQTFHGLYGFRSGGVGVGHGGTTGGTVTKELAEYVLSVAASQIVLLVDLSIALEQDVPF